MSGNSEDDKESQKSLPLDLARSQITTIPVRTVEGKAPLLMTTQSFRGIKMPANSATGAVQGQTIITANIVPQAVLKPGSNRAQIGIITSSQAQPQGTGNLTIQRPGQITLSAPIVAQTVPTGTSYHVPRGPAVVANLAAPRSNVTTVRTPMVVTAQSGQGHTFVRPPRTPSPAPGTAWLTTNSSNGSQIKGAPTVLSSPVRGATVTGKPQIVGRAQPVSQTVSAIRPATILQNAITLGQSGQIHSFKPGTTGIQALGSAVTIAQVVPSRTQTVYNPNTSTQLGQPTRLTVATTVQNQRQIQAPRTVAQVTTTRLTVPVNVTQTGARLVTPQATVLTPGARISAVAAPQQQQVLGGASARIVTSQPNVTIGRLSVAASPAQVSSTSLLGQTRISTLNLHSLMAVANTNQSRAAIQGQGPKVISQPQGTIHLTPLPSPVKTTSISVTTTTTRTISVPAAIVTQRQTTVVPSQAISIAKVYSQNENQVQGSTAANLFIHTPVSTVPRRSSPSPTSVTQTTSSSVATTTAAYSLAHLYDRSFGQQATPFAALSQASQQQFRQTPINTQVHGIVANQQMRFNSVMVVDNRNAQYEQTNQEQPQQAIPTKVTSSPRPSILRKRDHEGSPLKAAKNLAPVLATLPPQSQAPISPPSRPDSRGNGHSSGGSTTISATSSPGLAEVNEDSMPHVPMNNKEEEDVKPPMEMSPRKKPRKQQLTGNDIDENNDDMQFLSENTTKKEPEDSEGNQSDEPKDGAPEAGQVTTVRKPATASLLNFYKQTWKATHNHYLRYSDVRPKDERRPTIMDLANQYRVQEKVNGWKIHHLSTQMEDLADQEQTVYDQLTELLKCTESAEASSKYDKDVNRINELIKGNLQRIKIINDGMIEAKSQIMKIFDHKVHVTDIINRCASKRNFKKREKS